MWRGWVTAGSQFPIFDSDDASAARTALAALCQAYWYPLYAYVRRHRADAEDARDLTQAKHRLGRPQVRWKGNRPRD